MYFWAREGFVRPAIDLGIALERFLSSPFCCVASQCLDICQFPWISVDFRRIFAAFVSRAGPPGPACAPAPRSAPRPQHVHPPPRRVSCPLAEKFAVPAFYFAHIVNFWRVAQWSLWTASVVFSLSPLRVARRSLWTASGVLSLSPLCVARRFLWTACRVFFFQPVRGAVVLVDCEPRFCSHLCVARWSLWTACRVFLQPVRGAVVLVDCLPRFPPTRAWRSGPCGLPAAFSCNLCVAQWSSWTACRVILLSRYCFFLSLFSSFFPTLPPPPSSPPLARPACAMDVQKERYDCSQCDEHFRATPRQVDHGWLPNGWRYSRARNLLCQTCSEYHTQGENGEVNIKDMQLAEFEEKGRLHCGHCNEETVAVLKSKKGVYRCATCAIEQWAGDKVSRPRYWMEELEKHANEVHNRLAAKQFFDPEGDVRSELIKGTKEYRNSAGRGPEAMALMFHMARVVNRHLDAEP